MVNRFLIFSLEMFYDKVRIVTFKVVKDYKEAVFVT